MKKCIKAHSEGICRRAPSIALHPPSLQNPQVQYFFIPVGSFTIHP